MSFPILLLNLTLVLSALSAAYFHRRDAHAERFNESPFDQERGKLIEAAEQISAELSRVLSDLVGHIRQLRKARVDGPPPEWRAVAHQLGAVIALYRAENGRARSIDPRRLPPFSSPVRLELDPATEWAGVEVSRGAEEYEVERERLARRFEEARTRFKRQTFAEVETHG